MARPAVSDSSSFYHNYISYVEGSSIAEIIANHSATIHDFYNSLPEDKADHAYAPGKWTIRDLLQHVIDAERVFTYRAMRIARKDSTPLASFDENTYAENARDSSRSFQSLKDELNAVRNATDIMLSTFNEDQLQASGIASNNYITANAIAFIIYGHLLHHKTILEERYLS